MSEIDDDTPLPLKEAARRAFPAGGMTAAKLRRAIDSGRLQGYQVGRTVFTTLSDIRTMLETSVIKPQPRTEWKAAASAPPDPLARSAAAASLDNALAKLRHLKKPKR